MTDEQTSNFDPFTVCPPLRKTKDRSSVWFILPGAILGLAAILTAILEGNFGRIEDFQLLSDIKRVFGIGREEPSAPSFPLIRDYTSVVIACVIAATGALVHQQWRYMEQCLRLFQERGVLDPREKVEFGWLDNMLYGRTIKFEAALYRSHSVMRMFKAGGSWALFLSSLVLVLLLCESEERHGVFGVLVPSYETLPPEQRQVLQQTWVETAYNSWWAGSQNTGGKILYIATATFGLFVVLVQNIVGLSCVHAIMVLGRFHNFEADWLNSDGRYGWAPATRTFRTVGISLIVHGLMLTMLLITLGIQNFRWLIGLVVLWVLVMPLYTLVPWRVFGRVKKARGSRISELCGLHGSIKSAGVARLQAEQVIRAEMEAVNRAELHPFIQRRTLIPVAITIVLPVILTLAQILIPLRFGKGGP